MVFFFSVFGSSHVLRDHAQADVLFNGKQGLEKIGCSLDINAAFLLCYSCTDRDTWKHSLFQSG